MLTAKDIFHYIQGKLAAFGHRIFHKTGQQIVNCHINVDFNAAWEYYMILEKENDYYYDKD